MTIEFNAPKGQVKEWVMIYLMRKMIDIHNTDQDISRVQVVLRQQPHGLKSCVIAVTIYGDSLFVNRSASTYEEASLQALTECQNKLPEMRKQEPTQIVSTVRM